MVDNNGGNYINSELLVIYNESATTRMVRSNSSILEIRLFQKIKQYNQHIYFINNILGGHVMFFLFQRGRPLLFAIVRRRRNFHSRFGTSEKI